MSQSNVTRSMVIFPDGRQAVLVETLPSVTASEIIKTLDLTKPEAVILIPGGGDLTEQLNRGMSVTRLPQITVGDDSSCVRVSGSGTSILLRCTKSHLYSNFYKRYRL